MGSNVLPGSDPFGPGVADRYPDGQLFADLRGHDDQPPTAAQVAVRFLAALTIGVDHRAEPADPRRSTRGP